MPYPPSSLEIVNLLPFWRSFRWQFCVSHQPAGVSWMMRLLSSYKRVSVRKLQYQFTAAFRINSEDEQRQEDWVLTCFVQHVSWNHENASYNVIQQLLFFSNMNSTCKKLNWFHIFSVQALTYTEYRHFFSFFISFEWSLRATITCVFSKFFPLTISACRPFVCVMETKCSGIESCLATPSFPPP